MRSAISFRHCLKTVCRSAMSRMPGVADVHLVLAEAPLALRALDWHAEAYSDGARGVEELLPRPLEDVVVLEYQPGRPRVRVALLPAAPDRSPEEIDIRARRRLRCTRFRRPLHLAAQNAARRHRAGRASAGPGDRRGREPSVEPRGERSVLRSGTRWNPRSPSPSWRTLPGHRLHLHVHRQQVIAGVGAVAATAGGKNPRRTASP